MSSVVMICCLRRNPAVFTEQKQQPTGCEHKHYPKIYTVCLYFILLGSVNTSAYQKKQHLTQHFKMLKDAIPFPGVNNKDQQKHS